MQTPLLSISHVSKAFDGIFALQDVTFDVFEGECLALVGENGAGKSTLMKILSGVWPTGTFNGKISFAAKPLALSSPLDGRRCGISIIHQELCLFPKLSVAENLFLTESYPYDGKPSQTLTSRVRWQDMYSTAQALFNDLGFDVNARANIEDLSVAKRQLVEIARAFHHRAKILILDEPTSALSKIEIEHLFRVIRRMRGEMTFIYISHKFDEIFDIADRIVVLRDGKAVASLKKTETEPREVIRHMVGRPLKEGERESNLKEATEVFRVSHLSHTTPSGKELLTDMSFSVNAGEVFAIAGLMGSGRSELLRSLLGILPGERKGEILFLGKNVNWSNVREAMDAGVAFVPEDRKKDGLFLNHSIDFNLTISTLKGILGKFGLLNLEKEQTAVSKMVSSFGVKCSSPKELVKNLSGGNQQKVLLAKNVAQGPKVLMLDEPTRGIDVGAKEEIYSIIRKLSQSGIAIILVSSELPEVLALSDRVLVLREGKIMGELKNENLTQEEVMAFASGEKNAVH